jgi:hypothetical protein
LFLFFVDILQSTLFHLQVANIHNHNKNDMFILTEKVPVVLTEKYPVDGTKIQLIFTNSCYVFIQVLDCFLKSNPKLGGLIFTFFHFFTFSFIIIR